MPTNPYSNSERLAELLWEFEMVADNYMEGGIVLIRTKDGWRAFLGTFRDDALQGIERALDRNLPSFEKSMGQISRTPNLIEEFERALPDCMRFPNYYPMKLSVEAEKTDNE